MKSPLVPAPVHRLGGGNVHVWILDLAVLGRQEVELLKYLDESERDRARRFISSRESERFSLFRAAFRQMLGWYASCDPRRLELVRNRNGKPAGRVIESGGGSRDLSNLAFNYSHSHDFAVFAIARVADLGVDVEKVRLPNAIATLMEHFFLPQESAVVLASPPESQGELFCRLWTRKEAVVKSFGGSLAEWIGVIDVHGEADQLILRHAQLPTLHLRDIPVVSGYSA
ncbi:MAG TPA: 4'-phosphopantetheinyl transferase superfamily protein, partial [Spirochaetia bacterium]|nr:4'-phosphopantetheinyl transferase superfamily protein [Spirochaetia bacterium]